MGTMKPRTRKLILFGYAVVVVVVLTLLAKYQMI